MTLHQIIFHTEYGDLVVIQGTNQADIFKDAYARYLSLEVYDDDFVMECFNYKTLNLNDFFTELLANHSIIVPVDAHDNLYEYYKVYIHYNTWEVLTCTKLYS